MKTWFDCMALCARVFLPVLVMTSVALSGCAVVAPHDRGYDYSQEDRQYQRQLERERNQ